MLTYSYQTTEDMRAIDPLLLDDATTGDEIFNLFPITNVDSDRLVWEQRDSYRGLQQVRGLNGEPPRVRPVGRNRYSFEPGVYGEHMDVDEVEMTRRASAANRSVPIPIDDLISERRDQLLIRQLNRQRWICWTLLVQGKFTVLNDAGAIVHADAYDNQVYSAPVTWATWATATPIANLRAVSVLPRGTSASLGAGATAWMNQLTFNDLIQNTNANDLGGQKMANYGPARSEADVNTILLSYGLPKIRVYDDGYLDDTNTWTPWIPNNRSVVIGRRANGAPLGEMRQTRNVNNGDGGAGAYYKIIDHLDMKVPRKIEVHRGWNGGAVMYFPGAVCVMVV